ncbi:helix-turn-helix domain-containing protein [Prolixibacter sp. SD074]|uniref:helix-turn-helix domain-containing protein n=1 Tax=Prolixibacter sp. SD074 TaxID=2652391 RepID=UPI001280BA99|nr:helix-turn-helix domain-containing protein [Prolixibacter sp. SD074]GET28779.1 transposase [Prolixibacter sp. SD074]
MSSNIQVQRICQHCGKEFTAKTTVTKYCSDLCAKRAYKARIKAAKVEATNKETRQIKARPMEELKAKEYLTITETCQLLSVSRWTIWRAIKNNDLKAGNIGRRKLIKRSDIDKLINQSPKPQQENKIPQPARSWNIEDCYNMKQIQEKYSISEKGLYSMIKRNNIPKIKRGKYTYVQKSIIDNLLSEQKSFF